MTEVPDIQVSVKGFRAIASADIIINGITLAAGENGSGKSSISKLLYFLYKTVADYEKIVNSGLASSLRDVVRLGEIIHQENRIGSSSEEFDIMRKDLQEFRRSRIGELSSEQIGGKLTDLIEKLENKFYDLTTDDTSLMASRKKARVKRILADVTNSGEESDENIQESFARVKDLIAEEVHQAEMAIALRPTSVFIAELADVFSEGDLPEKFEVLEYGSPIVALDIDHLSIPYNIQNVVYIDSPMMFHADISKNIHWEDLSELLSKTGGRTHDIADIISRDILSGEVIVDEMFNSPDDFKFKRADGKIFDFIDVATGFKSFSILQLLLKNGTITDKTLMIIDEPESNLHPQWIIEYARIIVMLNKEIGCKFFLASHNPDMVSAIRYISERQGSLDKVNFYLAEKSDYSFEYNYKHLGNEIDPIFASFNIAIDRINQYGI
ncbi:AAA family ATPase [Mucilaginibacter sp.]|jgi:ABC-type Mn2+/Zn2+ transport system ATPase subunit|uniref:AAA family ATPase n=1 Tax=Mucilaginibacter sp. TaxID=1882438 RepID=UPI002C1A6BEB|nr:AAA family ATPase [Mucilaginibacter sp.]HTI57427.1 AAA family ATPase [Mucilaginibacter sp.]